MLHAATPPLNLVKCNTYIVINILLNQILFLIITDINYQHIYLENYIFL